MAGRHLLINRNFARLWLGDTVSTVGDFVFDTTLVLWVATVLADGRPWAPAAVSGIMLSVGAAVLFVGPLAGVFVDRWNRKATMLRTEVVRAVLAAALAVLSFLPVHAVPVWLWLTVIYLVVFALNTAGQFFSPARFGAIGDVVDGMVERTRATGLGQATNGMASIIGPPLAAPLLFAAGIQWALLLNALSFVFSYFAIRSVPLPDTAPGPSAARSRIRAEFVAGLRFFRGSRSLVTILTVVVIVQLGAGVLNALDVFFVTQTLHAPSRLYGILSMALGVGAILGSLVAARAVGWLGARTAAWLALLIVGVLIIGYARQTAFVPALVIVVLFSIPVAIVNTVLTPMILAVTPQHFLGRVLAVLQPVAQLASMLSVVIGGALASAAHGFHATVLGLHIGAVDTIFTGTGVLILLGGLYGWYGLPRDSASTTDQG